MAVDSWLLVPGCCSDSAKEFNTLWLRIHPLDGSQGGSPSILRQTLASTGIAEEATNKFIIFHLSTLTE
jgi:hypothetical protein